jgi:hypothetical protein
VRGEDQPLQCLEQLLRAAHQHPLTGGDDLHLPAERALLELLGDEPNDVADEHAGNVRTDAPAPYQSALVNGGPLVPERLISLDTFTP